MKQTKTNYLRNSINETLLLIDDMYYNINQRNLNNYKILALRLDLIKRDIESIATDLIDYINAIIYIFDNYYDDEELLFNALATHLEELHTII